MDGLQALIDAGTGRSYAASRQPIRQKITAIEYETKLLPKALIKADGSLDLYDDVQKLFDLVFDKGRPAVQCKGWLGYIPLNDHYALEVNPRVPIGNLERLIGMAAGYSPQILKKYTRKFAHAVEQPAALFDVLADHLLAAFDGIWENGLIRSYEKQERIGSSPAGRIGPYETAWRTAKMGRPTAASSVFFRTPDFGPNRVLRFAFEKLLGRYIGASDQGQYSRARRIKLALHRLEGIGSPSAGDMSSRTLAEFIKHLPSHHEYYADALMLAQLVMLDMGFSIRGSSGLAVLPSILIDMAKVFESYVRRILADAFSGDVRIEVLDGNRGGPGGARMSLFDPQPAFKNPAVTPDIVVKVEGSPRLIIDAKYKQAPNVPERSDINQVILYCAKYDASMAMLLHAGRGIAQVYADPMGNIGSYAVYNGALDLNAADIHQEEKNFAASVKALLE
jgi:5-methylcytosine-specific restriction enzyme subunit McrC